MDVSDWLRKLDLGVYADVFRANAIDADVLQDLSDADLEKMGVLLGHRRKLLRAIAALDTCSAEEKSSTASGDPAERRQVTIMFADLVGSTALTHALDPEEVREILSAYRQACGAAVVAHGGHVAKFLGDGVLAYFGLAGGLRECSRAAVCGPASTWLQRSTESSGMGAGSRRE